MEKIENSERPKFNFNNIRKEIEDAKPDPKDFGNNNPYSDEEVARDLKQLENIKSNPEYRKDTTGLSDSELQEYATTAEMISADWFSDDLRASELFAGGEGAPTLAISTSEFDDHVNHIDAICVINNAHSDYRPLPFALDFTYNTSLSLYDKFHWKHPSPKIDLPGFCTAKYFEDRDTFDPAATLPKGKIEVMPRFVVGFDKELSEQILRGQMTGKSSWDLLAFEEPSEKAKFCVLGELALQADQMLAYLTAHEDDKPAFKDLKTNVAALKKYFDGALNIARQNDPQNFESYSGRDPVFQAITSSTTF